VIAGGWRGKVEEMGETANGFWVSLEGEGENNENVLKLIVVMFAQPFKYTQKPLTCIL
jgi:hypothetical protein